MTKKTPPQKSAEELRAFAHELRNILSALYTYEQVLELSLQEKHMESETDVARSMAELIKKIETLLRTEIDGGDR